MNQDTVSTHVFVMYPDTGKHLLKELSKIYHGNTIYLSLIDGNLANEDLINTAKENFDINVIYVDNAGTDQYGFYHSFKYDNLDTKWILYCHDKHPSKINWLNSMISTFYDISDDLLLNEDIGIISSKDYEDKVKSFDDILSLEGSLSIKSRKILVESMHTLVWYLQLQRILLLKYEIADKEHKYTNFSAGNFFLAKRNIVEKAHGCVCENFFNKGVYRLDGEVEHGLERFYFYVSKCLGYNNIFK